MKSLRQFKEEQMGEVHDGYIVNSCKIEGQYLIALNHSAGAGWWEVLYIERRDGSEDSELKAALEAGEICTGGATYDDCVDGLYESGFIC